MKIDESQLKYAFEMFDSNHDGCLNTSEIKQLLANIDIEVSDSVIQRIVKEASKSGKSISLGSMWNIIERLCIIENGLVKEQEFLVWFSRFKTPKEDDAEADLKAAFMVFDKDGNGYITRDELKSAMQVIGETLTDRDLDELLRTTDHDNDGKINYEEFIKTLL